MTKCDFKLIGLFLIFSVLLAGCMTSAQHQQNLSSTQEKEMTVGIVKKEIRVGMSQADVAASLGSPNIVSKDSDSKEVWIYDKIATEASYSREAGGVSGAGGAAGTTGTTLLLGFISGGYGKSSGVMSTTQKTLTVIIRFDKSEKVESFSYHASKF